MIRYRRGTGTFRSMANAHQYELRGTNDLHATRLFRMPHVACLAYCSDSKELTVPCTVRHMRVCTCISCTVRQRGAAVAVVIGFIESVKYILLFHFGPISISALPPFVSTHSTIHMQHTFVSAIHPFDFVGNCWRDPCHYYIWHSNSECCMCAQSFYNIESILRDPNFTPHKNFEHKLLHVLECLCIPTVCICRCELEMRSGWILIMCLIWYTAMTELCVKCGFL